MAWQIGFSNEKMWRPLADWNDIERALEQLNDADHTHFDVSEDGKHYMRVYQGRDNRVMVEYYSIGWGHEILHDPRQTIPVTIKRWEGWDLPAEICVDKSLAQRALKHFYETQGFFLKGLRWGPRPILWKLWINQDAYPVRTLDQIERAIDQMDSDKYAYVRLCSEYADRHPMEVYGGEQGRVLLIYRDRNGDLDFEPLLVDRTQTQPMHVSGLFEDWGLGDLPPHYCVAKDLAKRALLHFFETQRLDDALEWIDPYDNDSGPIQGEPRIYP